MYCSKCGNQVLEGEKFCAKCGNPVSNLGNTGTISITRPVPQFNEQTATQSTPVVSTSQVVQPSPKKKSKFWLFLLFILLLGLAGGVAFGYFYSNSNSETGRESRRKDKEEVSEKVNEDSKTNDSSETSTAAPSASASSSPSPTPTPTATPKVYSDDEIKTLVYGNMSQFYKNYINAINNKHIEWVDHVNQEVSDYIYKRYKENNEGYTFTIHKIWIDDDSIKITKKSDDKYVVTFDYGADITYYKNGTKESHPKMHVTMEINPSNNDWILTRSENDRNINTSGHRVIDITNY